MTMRRRRRASRAMLVGLLLMSCLVVTVERVSTAVAAASCASGATMNVVAHEDDDLLFQNPNLLHEVQAGRCVRTVYFTAGDANEMAWYWQGRETGVQAAYAQMAGVANTWTTSDAGIVGHPITLLTLTGAPNISLAFMHLPDGNIDGTGFSNDGYESLQKLYGGAISTIDTVNGTGSYTLSDLEATLLALMNSYQPDSINTLDYVGTYGDGDHSDHHTVAYLTALMQQQYTTPHGFAGYQGYGISNEPANVGEPDSTTKENVFLTYAADDYKECSTDAACSTRPESTWFDRQYTVGTPIPIPTTASPTTTTTSTTATPTTTTSTTTTSTAAPSTNVAGSATATASSQNTTTGQTADKAIDGVIDGYPGDYTKEWATSGGKANSWLQLTWPTAVTLNKVVLYDRPNTSDQVTAGKLTFSDGSTVTVPSLDNSGAAVTVTFTARSTTTLRFTITAVSKSTTNVGLAELQAWTA